MIERLISKCYNYVDFNHFIPFELDGMIISIKEHYLLNREFVFGSGFLHYWPKAKFV